MPQVFNARRPGVDTPLAPYPRQMKVYEACMALPAFADADPAKQPDAVPLAAGAGLAAGVGVELARPRRPKAG